MTPNYRSFSQSRIRQKGSKLSKKHSIRRDHNKSFQSVHPSSGIKAQTHTRTAPPRNQDLPIPQDTESLRGTPNGMHTQFLINQMYSNVNRRQTDKPNQQHQLYNPYNKRVRITIPGAHQDDGQTLKGIPEFENLESF